MGVQRGEAPLAGAGQRPAGVWGEAPTKGEKANEIHVFGIKYDGSRDKYEPAVAADRWA